MCLDKKDNVQVWMKDVSTEEENRIEWNNSVYSGLPGSVTKE